MPHAGLGGRSVYERAPDTETDPRSPPPRAEFAFRYSRYYSVLNSVLGTRLLAVLFISGLSNREVTISLRSPTLGSVGSKTQSVINRRSRRASLAAPHLIPRLTHVP